MVALEQLHLKENVPADSGGGRAIFSVIGLVVKSFDKIPVQ